MSTLCRRLLKVGQDEVTGLLGLVEWAEQGGDKRCRLFIDELMQRGWVCCIVNYMGGTPTPDPDPCSANLPGAPAAEPPCRKQT